MKTIKAKVALYLSTKTISALLEFVDGIIEKMTGNPNFVTPEPSLAAVTTAKTELAAAQAQKKVLGIENRNNKLYALLDLITQLGAYVTVIADGDGAIIESAGMQVAKHREKKAKPDAVTGIEVADGVSSGQVEVSHGGAGAGKGNEYFTEYTTDMTLAENSWQQQEPTGKRKVVISALAVGVKTAFRVRAKNTAGFGAYSTIAFRIIQ